MDINSHHISGMFGSMRLWSAKIAWSDGRGHWFAVITCGELAQGWNCCFSSILKHFMEEKGLGMAWPPLVCPLIFREKLFFNPKVGARKGSYVLQNNHCPGLCFCILQAPGLVTEPRACDYAQPPCVPCFLSEAGTPCRGTCCAVIICASPRAPLPASSEN